MYTNYVFKVQSHSQTSRVTILLTRWVTLNGVQGASAPNLGNIATYNSLTVSLAS